MDYIAELAAIAKEHGGIIETKIAAQHGISKAMLYKLCKEDRIHRIVKGQYILPDDMEDELLSISKRSTQIIFSHETALFLHGISDRTPFEHTITAPSGCIPSGLSYTGTHILCKPFITFQKIIPQYLFMRRVILHWTLHWHS